mmetsp:Transcript_8519/g.26222  ORF Transcript_8519/g.26222 Transcript_8519/m.26222 type:complete len:200 (+) Transcript_8519:3125-3724(+)
MERRFLRWRNEKTVAHVFATADRKHDTHAVQLFLTRVMDWFNETVPDEKFTKAYLRSDNAGQHFKNRYSLRFLTALFVMYNLQDAAWDYGCPGHGKGPWDGLGGMIKSWLRRTVLAMGIDEVDLDAKDCYERLKAHFDSDEWRAEHADKTIQQIIMHWVDEATIQRPSHYAKAEDGKIVVRTNNHEVMADHAPLLLSCN